MSEVGGGYISEPTVKQRRFCESIVGGATQEDAAIFAGYSKKTAYAQGCRLMKSPVIRSYISKITEPALKKAGVTADYVIDTIVETIESARIPNPIYDKQGNIRGYKSDYAAVLKGCELLGRYHDLGMWVDKSELSNAEGSNFSINLILNKGGQNIVNV